MRILFVAMGNSIHAARWVAQLEGRGWDIGLFPVENVRIHPHFRERAPSVRILERWPLPRGRSIAERIVQRVRPGWSIRTWELTEVLRAFRPDVVHSLELQQAGYRTLDARQRLGAPFPAWIVTNWGSDIALFGQLPEHAVRIRDLLRRVDYYTCECERDVELARTYGFGGRFLDVMPSAGGLDLEKLPSLRSPGRPSDRRLVVLKGYQGWAGRALFGLRALEQCVDALAGYRVAVYLASPDVELAARLFSRRTGVPIEIVHRAPHAEILRLHGRARVSIGLSIGDGISTSFLEAIAMGSFPIQSNAGCAEDWVRDGESGALVHPEDVDGVAVAVRGALEDDELVDRAAQLNAETVASRLDGRVLAERAASLYERVAAETR